MNEITAPLPDSDSGSGSASAGLTAEEKNGPSTAVWICLGVFVAAVVAIGAIVLLRKKKQRKA